MAERKTYTAEDFKGCNGRRVLVEGVIDHSRLTDFGNVVVTFPREDSEPRASAYVSPSAIVEILPEELRVGDKVCAKHGQPATLLCVHEGEAWLGFPDGCGTFNLSDLTLVERGQ